MLNKMIKRWLDHSLLAKVGMQQEDSGFNKTLVAHICESLVLFDEGAGEPGFTDRQLDGSKDSLREAEKRNEANLLRSVVNTYVARGAIRFVGKL